LAIVFIGSQSIGHDCLNEVLNQGVVVDALFTFEPDPHEKWSRSTDTVAKKHGIPIFFPNELTVEKIKEINPDLILIVGYRKLIPQQILDIPKKGVIGLHASLLPHLRGQAPLNWSIIIGDTKAGVTMFKMDKGIDTGDIIGQKETLISSKDTIVDLKQRIQKLSVELVVEFVPKILNDDVRMKKQPKEGTYGCARIPEDAKIDWSHNSANIYNLIRGSESTYAAFTYHNSKKLYVKKAEIVNNGKKYFGVTGQVAMTNKDGSVIVVTGDGVIKITKVNFENEDEVDAKNILNSSKIRLK
jgi:methionyl-tRNA formyltransferase